MAKRISQREFEKRVSIILRGALAELSPKQQDAALKRMEKAIRKP